jgi:integrase
VAKQQYKDRQKTKYAGVFRLPDGRWLIEATQRDHDRKRVFRNRVLEASLTLEEAARERAALVLDLAEEIRQRAEAARAPEPDPGPRTTLADFSERWIELKTERKLKGSTRTLYKDVLAHRILPVLGEVPIEKLTRRRSEEWVAWAEAQRTEDGEHYAVDTLRGWWRVCKQILRDAAAEAGLPDPVNRVRPPDSPVTRRTERGTLSPEQIGKLLAAVEERHPGWYAQVYVCIFSGMRPGELYALTWDDVDYREGIIRIRRAVRRGEVGTTKTGDPRDAAITGQMRQILEAQRRKLVAEQHPGLKLGLVFPADTGGYRGSEALLKVLGQAGKLARLPVKVGPRVLRRTFNSRAVEAGVDKVVLRGQLGHSSEEMTEHYFEGHAEPKREIVRSLEKRVEEAAGGAGSTRR